MDTLISVPKISRFPDSDEMNIFNQITNHMRTTKAKAVCGTEVSPNLIGPDLVHLTGKHEQHWLPIFEKCIKKLNS